MWDFVGAKETQDSGTLVPAGGVAAFSNGVVGLSGCEYSAINQFLTGRAPG